VLIRDLQTAPVGARQQLWFILIATTPNGADCMNDVSRLVIASGGNHCITNRTTADTPTFLVNLWAAFRMNCAIGAIALVEPPMRRRDNGVRILFCDVAGNQPQRCLSDFCFHENDRIARPAPCPTEIDRPVKPILPTP
jgi:hypothetical protein